MLVSIGPNASKGFGRCTQALSAKSRQHHWSGAGPLSIKCFFGGEAIYTVGRGRYTVGPGSYLILNHGQAYEISLESRQPVESFCLFFAPGVAESALRSAAETAEKLLDDPDATRTPARFFERTYAHDAVLSPKLFALRDQMAARAGDPLWLEQAIHEIAAALAEVHVGESRQAQSLRAVRSSTREELHRRLHRARDFMISSLGRRLTLAEISSVACLSVNHFLRSFKEAFGQSPRQFVIEKRMERAAFLLSRTDLPVTQVCADCGFESLGSFSSLFRKRAGCSPLEHRRKR